MPSLSVLLAFVTIVPQILAHGGQGFYEIDGTRYEGWSIDPDYWPWGHYNDTTQNTIQRPWFDINPIRSNTVGYYTPPPQWAEWLACNEVGLGLIDINDPTWTEHRAQLGFNPSQLTATINAGSSISSRWIGGPENGDPYSPWYHDIGPVISYLARCPGSTCNGVEAKSLKWFKIDESGLLEGTVANGYWANTKMIADNSTWTTVIPASVPSGAYLYRHETINLASAPVDLQIFVQCAQLNIVDGGSLEPTESELVTFPGAYTIDDPGLNMSIYTTKAQTQTTYQIPGPPLYAGAKARSSTSKSAKFRRAH